MELGSMLTTLSMHHEDVLPATKQVQVNAVCAAIDRENNLCISVKKTQEMMVDFRHLPPPLHIGETAVEVVSSYRYLGVHITDDLTWRHTTSTPAPLLPQEVEMRRTWELSPHRLSPSPQAGGCGALRAGPPD